MTWGYIRFVRESTIYEDELETSQEVTFVVNTFLPGVREIP